MILIFIVGGAGDAISYWIHSTIHGYIDEPPDITILPYKSFLISTSHLIIELQDVSWIPDASIPKNDGWNIASGHLNLSFPIVITCPSGNS